MKKYYIATSLNGQKFALIADQKINESKYQKVTEASMEECEKQAKETELITIINGITSKYLYNSAKKEFDCTYSSAGTNSGANDWGFAR